MENEIKLIPKFIEFSEISSFSQKEEVAKAETDKNSESSLFFNLKNYLKVKFFDNSGEDNNNLIIIFVRMKDLTDYNKFCKRIKKLHHITNAFNDEITRNEKEMYKPYKPIITVGLEDICYLENMPELKKLLNLHPCYRFLDSSIWHRYVPLMPYENMNPEGNDGFINRFEEVLEDIKFYYEYGFYYSAVSYEFLEFQTRLLLNSYVAYIGKGAHSKAIYPFMFHSETEMKNKTRHIIKENRLIDEVEWNLLLVDDYAEESLTDIDNEYQRTKNKKDILEELIGRMIKEKEQDDVEFDNIFKISLPSETTKKSNSKSNDIISNTLEALKERMYDVILLDYLLEEKKSSDYSGKYGNRYYGDELLEKFIRFEENPEKNDIRYIKGAMKNRGPMGRFWIFPISAFSDAMLNSIRERGISHFSDVWHLSSGADPINTPNLFVYKFFTFLKEMKAEALFDEAEMKNFFKNNMIFSYSDDYNNREDRGHKPVDSEIARKWAGNILGRFLYKFGKHEGLTIEKESIRFNGNKENTKSFYESIYRYINNKKQKEKEYYEHIKNLLLLLAYGSGMEWPEMWEEVQCEYVEKIIGEENYEIIVDYISNMQSQYR